MIGLRVTLGEEAFGDWGWRVPFLVSIALLGVSLWIRLKLNESPVFQRMKEQGTTSKAPLREAFGEWKNLKFVLIALFGAVAGQAVLGYTGQFYTLFYLERIARVDGATANIMIAIALALVTPFFVLFGWLSDRIGRKPLVVTGCLLAVVGYFPLFAALTHAANPALAIAIETTPVTVVAHDAECSFQFDPIGRNSFDATSCDIAKAFLAKGGTNYANVEAPAGSIAEVRIGAATIVAPDPTQVTGAARAAAVADFRARVGGALAAAGYPEEADPATIDKPLVVAILFAILLPVTMVYGPMAALLVELFPARIRYSALSLPYHVGNGWFGGFLPTTAFAMVAATGDIYYGLWYPVVIAAMTLVVGLLFLPETFRRKIDG